MFEASLNAELCFWNVLLPALHRVAQLASICGETKERRCHLKAVPSLTSHAGATWEEAACGHRPVPSLERTLPASLGCRMAEIVAQICTK